MPRYALLVSVVIAACSVELAEPDRSDPFTQIGGSTGTGSTGNGGSGEEGGGGGTFGGSGGVAGAGAGGFGATGGSSGNACLDCNQAQCPKYQECLATPNCVYLGNCISNCTDPGCQVSCLNTYNSAYDLYFDMLSCQYLSCGAECGDPFCNSCQDTNCIGQKVACDSSSECLGYWYCIATCVDGPCFEQCGQLWAGMQQYNDYVDCLEMYCSGVCF